MPETITDTANGHPFLDDLHLNDALIAIDPVVSRIASGANILRVPQENASFDLARNERLETGIRGEDGRRDHFICEVSDGGQGEKVTAHRTVEAYTDLRILNDPERGFADRAPRETRPIKGGLLTSLRQYKEQGTFLDIYDVNSAQRVRMELPKGYQFGAVDLDGSNTLTQVVVPERPDVGAREFTPLEEFVARNPGLVERQDGLLGVKDSQIDSNGIDTVTFNNPNTGIPTDLRLPKNVRFQQTEAGPNGELPQGIIVTYDASGNIVSRESAHAYLSQSLVDSERKPLVEQAREAVKAAGDSRTDKSMYNANVQQTIEAFEEHGELGKALSEVYEVAVAQYPELADTVVTLNEEANLNVAGGKSPGSATHPGASPDGLPHVKINVGDGLEKYGEYLTHFPASMEAVAKSLGIKMEALDAKTIAMHAFAHELGHIVDYHRNAPKLEDSRRRRAADMMNLPAPNMRSSTLRGPNGVAYFDQNKDFYAKRGIKSHSELVLAQQEAYRQMETERIPDQIASGIVQQLLSSQ